MGLYGEMTPEISVVPGRRGEGGGGCAAAEVVVETQKQNPKPKNQKQQTKNTKTKKPQKKPQTKKTQKKKPTRVESVRALAFPGRGEAKQASLAVVLSLLIMIFRLPLQVCW